MAHHPRYKRILLKLSGEALAGNQGYGIDPDIIRAIAVEIRGVVDLGVQIAVVIGGGNIFRGVAASSMGMDRASADYMGMLATVMNSLALQDALEKAGVITRVQSAIEMQEIAEPYIRRRAVRHLEKGRVVIFGAGTGNPFFTTDTAASLRAIEIGADILLKATKVDGVYDSDPVTNPDANRYETVSFDQLLADKLLVMDATAVVMCRDNELPLRVFDLTRANALVQAMTGDNVGTLVTA